MIGTLQRNHRGFTIVELMVVVAIIALLMALIIPSFVRARKRSQATTLLNNLRLIDSAKDQYAIENNKTNQASSAEMLVPYLKEGLLKNAALGAGSSLTVTDPRINGGNIQYLLGNFDILPSITTGGAFLDVTDEGFWSPFSAN